MNKRTNRTEEEKRAILALVGQELAAGSTLRAACAKHDIVESSYCNWRKRYVTKAKAKARVAKKPNAIESFTFVQSAQTLPLFIIFGAATDVNAALEKISKVSGGGVA